MPSDRNSSSLLIESLRGGMNSSDPPNALADDQAVVLRNIELHRTTVGAKRLGSVPITLDGVSDPILASSAQRAQKLYRHLPSADQSEAELWMVSQPSAGNIAQFSRKVAESATWETVTKATDVTPVTTSPTTANRPWTFAAQTFNSKVFWGTFNALASPGSFRDRPLVWDGVTNTLRYVGLVKAGGFASITNTGSGSVSGQRWYRLRFTVQDGSGVTLRRSEPSNPAVFTPSGAGAGVLITRGTAASEGITHWECEASTDGPDGNFYRIATTVFATTQITDTVSAPPGYSTTFPLSEPIGDYTPPHAPAFIAIDEDRVLWGGARHNPAFGSRVSWGPPQKAPGSGNDERVPIRTDNFLDLDIGEGGDLTGMVQAQLGVVYVFKWQAIYALYRTGSAQAAYRAEILTKSRGAVPGTVYAGADSQGRPVIFFCDPFVGPCLVGPTGLARCGRDVEEKEWHRVNLDATQIATGLYHPEEGQMRWWVATDGSAYPNEGFVLQLTHMQADQTGGYRRGWSLWSGPSCQVHTATLFAHNVDDDDPRSLKLVALVGRTPQTEANGLQILRTDVEDLDTDMDQQYFATGITRPYFLNGALNHFGIMNAVVVGERSFNEIPIDLIQDKDSGELSLGTDAVAFDAPTTPGNSLIVTVMGDGIPTGLAISDTVNGAYTTAVTRTEGGRFVRIAHVLASAGPVSSVTVSRTGSSPTRVCLWEFTPLRIVADTSSNVTDDAAEHPPGAPPINGPGVQVAAFRFADTVPDIFSLASVAVTGSTPMPTINVEIAPGVFVPIVQDSLSFAAVLESPLTGIDALTFTIVESPLDITNFLTDATAATVCYLAAVTGIRVEIGLVKNYGTEHIHREASFVPLGDEDQVIRPLDDLSMAEMTCVQIDIHDPPVPEGIWRLSLIACRVTGGQRS